MNIIYADLEYDNNHKVIEIAALHTHNASIKKIFHCFVKTEIQHVCQYFNCAENSHCIHPATLQNFGLNFSKATDKFESFIADFDGSITLKGNGLDMSQSNLIKLFPFFSKYDITYAQVSLPPWIQREKLDSHCAAYKMKLCTQLLPCSHEYHYIKFSPTWIHQNKTANHTRLAKLIYGSHCALIDCFELAFFESALPIYCCDVHFTDLFLTEPVKAKVPMHDNSFHSLIVKPPLVFY